MKFTLKIISAIIIITSAFTPAFAEKGFLFSGEEDTLSLYNKLSAELLKDPSGVNSYRNIVKLMELSREGGRGKTAKLFRVCAGEIKEREGDVSPVYFVLINYAGYLENDADSRDSLYKGIDKWLICGPWHKFGKADMYYPFLPETGAGFSEFKSIKVQQGSRVYPFGFIPERRGVLYAAASFSVDMPVRIWVITNGSFRLFVNRAEVMSSGIPGEESLSGVTIEGIRDYTLLLKIAENQHGEDTFYRVIITDLNNKELNPEITGAVNSGSGVHEEIFSSCKMKSEPGFPDGVKMWKIRNSTGIDNTETLYNEAKDLHTEYPLCGESYHTIIPLLISSGRESEFSETVSQYRKRFPGSDYYMKWTADFYNSRDEKKFAAVMDKIHLRYCGHDNAKAYIKFLADKGEKRAARRYCEKFEDVPSFRVIASEVEKSLSTPVQWRRYLLEKMAATGDPLYYYYMGNSEMDAGLDPVLYWEKGLSIRGDLREMRDAVDIFENAGGKGSIFYSGRYTDFHPEFLWNGIKRKVTVRIFANGKYMTECEELIPASLAETGEFALLRLKDLRVLYALRCRGGEAVPLAYEISAKDESVSVKLKKEDKADFIVLKYTGYSEYDRYPFYLMKDTELKREGEDISEIMLEVISEGIRPVVTFMEKRVPGEAGGKEGETVYRSSKKFNYKNSDKASVSAAYMSDEKEFSLWYNSMLKVLRKKGGIEQISETELKDMQAGITALQTYILKHYNVEEGVTFNPRFPGDVISSQGGSTEELAILTSAMAERGGVKGFIAFIREKGDTLSVNSEAALFIPELRGKGCWIRFTDRKNFKNPEALLIKGDSFEIIPVRDK